MTDNGGRLCNFCGKVEAEAIGGFRVCPDCQKRFKNSIGVMCAGCLITYWLPKTPHNVQWAAECGGVSQQYVMENAIVMGVSACRNCGGCPTSDSHTLH